ncbi:MAG: penicillin-binding protein 2 [Coriobacteriales bacterium]|nr:penicillin-binding protein 2 [Coriobacteriales bacterium]
MLKGSGKVQGSNRDRWILAVFVLLAVIVLGRLWWLQVVEASMLSAQAHAQRTNTIEVQARRGTIYDRNGNPLATSVEATTIYANPNEIIDPAATAQILTEIVGGDTAEYQKILTSGGEKDTFVYVLKKGDPALAQQLQERDLVLQQQIKDAHPNENLTAEQQRTALYGVHFLPDSKRVYPYGQIGAQILGSVNVDNEGVFGLELMYDSVLRGTNGQIVEERGKDLTPMVGGTQVTTPAVDGQDIIITLDIDLQQFVETELARVGAERASDDGSALVLDAATGEIYAAASLPLYDVESLTQEQIEKGATNLKPITSQYEPGSVFKAATAAAALEQNVMQPDTPIIEVPAALDIHGSIVTDSHPRDAEDMSLRTIIMESSNIGVSLVEREIGDATFHEYLTKYGFGQPTHVDFPYEATGLLAPLDGWVPIQAANISFGQGVAASPLQIASFYGAIANDGLKMQPHFLLAYPYSDTPPSYTSEQIMTPATATELTSILRSVVTDGTGTRSAVEGYATAGKTGTAEKAAETGGYLENYYVVSFAGFFTEAPSKFVCLTTMDNPLGAEGNAPTQPLFAAIMKFAATHYGILPDELTQGSPAQTDQGGTAQTPVGETTEPPQQDAAPTGGSSDG